MTYGGGGTRTRVEKIALFLDGEDLHLSAKALGFELDYRKLLEKFRSRGTILRAIYYIAIAQSQEQSSIRPLVDWLAYNGFSIVSKSAKEYVDAGGRLKVRGNMRIELAVDAMALAEQLDEIVLFSGSGDFQPVVKAVQRRGVRVTVVSTIATSPALAADVLRRQADCFVDLANLRSDCARHPYVRRTPHHNP
ncbi:NYN domain-containing protein [Bradyrhizobium rifense]|uniref:NYN domain-containing protein n=1 Tax=Bradyrhizobium rifense TaxID=515499 RepID=A0A5D3KRD0_9BRAD|nr:NYN domain-containing protein [Bradyrhizobium rifense]TYL99167.1 NYN domain-containing protein [Bradyrhizobium rifense]